VPSAGELLRDAAMGRVGVDRRLIRSILDGGDEAVQQVLAFAKSSHDSDRIDLDPLLVDLLRVWNPPEALDVYIDVIRRSPEDITDDLIQALLQNSPVPVRVVSDKASEVMALSDVLFIASGTATLQAAVVGTPMVLLYKTTPLTYRLARWLINVKWIGLVNLVADRSIVPELIQDEATGERLCQEVLRLLHDPSAYNGMKEGLRQVRDSLGEPGATSRAAQVVLAECRL